MLSGLSPQKLNLHRLPLEMIPKVYFPCPRGLAFGSLIGIEGFIVTELRGKAKVITRGIYEDSITRIIEASRSGEEGETAEQGILVSFSNNMFFPEDAGLALAIYDKLLRFEYESSYPAVYAAGHIDPAGNGMISPVKNFDRYCTMVRELGRQQGLFIFPQANAAAGKNSADVPAVLAERGITCNGINHSNELSDVLKEPGNLR